MMFAQENSELIREQLQPDVPFHECYLPPHVNDDVDDEDGNPIDVGQNDNDD